VVVIDESRLHQSGARRTPQGRSAARVTGWHCQLQARLLNLGNGKAAATQGMRITDKGISVTMQFKSDRLVISLASNGSADFESFSKQTPDVVLLDLKIPGSSAKDLCPAFKSNSALVPVVVLSANPEVEDRVLLLELGAEDYVKKPFSPKELLARVRRAMRRGSPSPDVTNVAPATIEHELLTFGDVRIDFTSMECTRAGKLLTLTAQQFKLLKFFARSSGCVVSRGELLDEVWGYENYPTTRTVDNCILRLRQKLEPDPANPRYFLTMYGAGYKFTAGGVAAAGQTNKLPAQKVEMDELVNVSGLSRSKLIKRPGAPARSHRNHELRTSIVRTI
jgi:DNA-binding response OmpR family regulator